MKDYNTKVLLLLYCQHSCSSFRRLLILLLYNQEPSDYMLYRLLLYFLTLNILSLIQYNGIPCL